MELKKFLAPVSYFFLPVSLSDEPNNLCLLSPYHSPIFPFLTLHLISHSPQSRSAADPQATHSVSMHSEGRS